MQVVNQQHVTLELPVPAESLGELRAMLHCSEYSWYADNLNSVGLDIVPEKSALLQFNSEKLEFPVSRIVFTVKNECTETAGLLEIVENTESFLADAFSSPAIKLLKSRIYELSVTVALQKNTIEDMGDRIQGLRENLVSARGQIHALSLRVDKLAYQIGPVQSEGSDEQEGSENHPC